MSGANASPKGRSHQVMRVLNIVGARPNFMKIAPIVEEMKKAPDLQGVLVHTGQHYDEGMSDVFFRDLGIPVPDVHLGGGSGSHAEQTARIMVEFEKVCLEQKPGMVLVVGDVNSTMACSIVAAKLLIPVAHVEAGLRSFDRTMPEEINRMVTDRLADILLTPSPDGNENLLREGVPAERIHLVGNIMIDTLFRHLPMACACASAGTRSSRCTGRRMWTTPKRFEAFFRQSRKSHATCPWCSPCIRGHRRASPNSAWRTASRTCR